MLKRYNVKVEQKGYWLKYSDCLFIRDIDDYKLYMTELNNKFTVAENEIKNNRTFIGHNHSMLTGVAGIGCGMIDEISEREPMLANLKLLQGSVLGNQLKDVLDGLKLVINKNGGYFSIKPDEKYEIEEISGNYQYTEADIKIDKWFGGKHYYAKICEIDVVDESGGTKWNTYEYAQKVAVKYMHILNERNVENSKTSL